jgi:ankyrin repeat protein
MNTRSIHWPVVAPLAILAVGGLGAVAHTSPRATVGQSAKKAVVTARQTETAIVAEAAQQHDGKRVFALIQQGRDVNQPQADGGTALHWAAHWDDTEMARRLVTAGARPNAVNDYGVTPLFLAAEEGHAQMVALLLNAGADPNAALPTGETVLMAAIRGGSLDVVKRLLETHANPNAAQLSQKQTALMWAISDDQVEITEALLKAGADVHAVSSSGSTPLMFAARTGDVEMAKLLVAAGDAINASATDGSTPLLVATVKGRPDFALFLLEQGANPDANFTETGYTPLMWAAATFDPIAIAYNGIEVDGEWATFSGIPDRAGKLRLVKSLIAHGANVNARLTKRIPELNPNSGGGSRPPHVGATAFIIAAQSADVEMMRLLVASGADPLLRASDGQTAIMAASEGVVENTFQMTQAKRIACIQAALEMGLGLEDQDDRGFRPMHVAARAGYHDIIKFLLSKGAEKDPLTKPFKNSYLGLAQGTLEPQSPLGLVEGTLEGIFYARPETAVFLSGLGFKSIGRYVVPTQPEADASSGDKASGGKEPPAAR